MTYTHPYLSTPYTLCVDIEPRGTQHSSFLLPVAGVCTLATPSPLPCVTSPPRGSSLNWSRVAEWRPGARSRRGDFATKRQGAAPGASGWPHQGQHWHCHSALSQISSVFQMAVIILHIMKYINKIVMSLRRKHYINMISTRFGWLLLCREEFQKHLGCWETFPWLKDLPVCRAAVQW